MLTIHYLLKLWIFLLHQSVLHFKFRYHNKAQRSSCQFFGISLFCTLQYFYFDNCLQLFNKLLAYYTCNRLFISWPMVA